MITEALFNRNADACETAKHPKCRCGCKGALHGKRHSKAWRSETYLQLRNEEELASLRTFVCALTRAGLRP